MSKTRVLLVEDSTVIRSIITRIFESDSGVEVVDTAANGEIGVLKYKQSKPDVVLMDIEMPIKDGITALTEIIEFDPNAKVIMCSTLTVKNAEITMRAMKIGAIDYIAKPTNVAEVGQSDEFKTQLLQLVKGVKQDGSASQSVGGGIQLRDKPPLHWKPQIIAVGSSTGGPQALFEFMKGVSGVGLPIVITQHMPATFTTLLAEHITQQAGIECVEGADGMLVEAGKAILAPGGKHMCFTKNAAGQVVVALDDGSQENFCKPAVDPMYRSLMDYYDGNILSVILTGMGADGQKGAEALIAKGGYCVAQDEKTSVVWGMPGAVATAGLCSAVLPLNEMAPWVIEHARTGTVFRKVSE